MPKTSKVIRGAKHIRSLRTLYTRDSLGRGSWTRQRDSEQSAQMPQVPPTRGNYLLNLGANLTGAPKGLSRGDQPISGSGQRTRDAYTGSAGKPKVGPPKNMRKFDHTLIGADPRELLVDIFDEGEMLLVVVELPGVAQEEIKLELTDGVLAFSTTGNRKYAKEVRLPAATHGAEMAMLYHHGVMAVRLPKAA